MDVVKAINTRRSIRHFKPDPVPESVLREIIEVAMRAPSAGNTQPWEIAVVSGAKLDKIKQAVLNSTGKAPKLDIDAPLPYPEPWASRYSAFAAGMFAQLGIKREEKEKRSEWGHRGYSLWGAPSCIYIMIDRAYYNIRGITNALNVFDCGLITQNILLLATEHGLGTIVAIQPVLYPDILRSELDIPDSKLMVIGIPIGYPVIDSPVNQLHTGREPLDQTARFYS
jgi:nitroreductase